MTDTPRDPLAALLEHLGYGDTTDRLTGGPDVYQEWGMTPREFAARLRAAGVTLADATRPSGDPDETMLHGIEDNPFSRTRPSDDETLRAIRDEANARYAEGRYVNPEWLVSVVEAALATPDATRPSDDAHLADWDVTTDSDHDPYGAADANRPMTDTPRPAVLICACPCHYENEHPNDTAPRSDDALRAALLRYGARHRNDCRATTLGPDPLCTCGLSAALATSAPPSPEENR